MDLIENKIPPDKLSNVKKTTDGLIEVNYQTKSY